MNRFAFLVPDAGVIETIREAFARHVVEYPFAEEHSVHFYVARNAREIPRQVLYDDVVLSRGVTSEELKQIFPTIPVIEIPIGPEMAAAVLQAIERYGRQPMAVIGSYNMGFTAMGLREVLGVDITAYRQESREGYAIHRYVETAIGDGRRIIICGPNTYAVATEMDCYPIVLGLSAASVSEALLRARGEMAARRREREKAALFQAVLDITQEGIITTDNHGRITACNAAAAALLDVSPTAALGEVIHRAVPGLRDGPVTDGSGGLVVACGGREVSLRRRQVFFSGEPLGQVVTLSPLDQTGRHPHTIS